MQDQDYIIPVISNGELDPRTDNPSETISALKFSVLVTHSVFC